jgi:hypothetical protein
MQYHFFKTCQSILDFFKRNAQIILRIFGLIQEKKVFFIFIYCFLLCPAIFFLIKLPKQA